MVTGDFALEHGTVGGRNKDKTALQWDKGKRAHHLQKHHQMILVKSQESKSFSRAAGLPGGSEQPYRTLHSFTHHPLERGETHNPSISPAVRRSTDIAVLCSGQVQNRAANLL